MNPVENDAAVTLAAVTKGTLARIIMGHEYGSILVDASQVPKIWGATFNKDAAGANRP